MQIAGRVNLFRGFLCRRGNRILFNTLLTDYCFCRGKSHRPRADAAGGQADIGHGLARKRHLRRNTGQREIAMTAGDLDEG